MIQAIVFDFGGVLVTDAVVRGRLAEFDAMLGWTPGAIYDQLYSGTAWEKVSTGAWTIDRYWAAVGAPLEVLLPENVRADFRRYRDPFFDEPLDLAMLDLAWRLRTRYPIGLLSNATVLLADRLVAERDLQGLFAVVVISALAGLRKPEPAAYHLVCHLLQLRLAACVLIDDKERNTNAARATGMQAIHHRHAASTQQALIDLGIVLDGSPKRDM